MLAHRFTAAPHTSPLGNLSGVLSGFTPRFKLRLWQVEDWRFRAPDVSQSIFGCRKIYAGESVPPSMMNYSKAHKVGNRIKAK